MPSSALYNFLSSFDVILFGDKLLEEDDLNAPYSFDCWGTTYLVFPPKLAFWNQLLFVSLIQSVFVAITSGVIYWTMIKPSEQQKSSNKIQNFLVGYGFVIPLCLIYPRFIIQLFGIRNKVIRFAFTAVPIASLFRCSEAMYGFQPSGLDKSFKKYFIYNLVPLEIDIDPKTKGLVKITRSYVIQNILQFLLGFTKVSILLSVLSSRDFIPFQVPSSFTLVTAFHPGRIMNHAITGILFEQILSVFAAGLSLLFAFLTGVQIVELMKSAMFSSKSPSDFWGRKWNRFIHSMLKRGVYKPVRRYSTPFLAAVAAFIASGLFHEWILYSIYVIVDSEKDEFGQCSSCYYPPTHGKQLAFFVWNAIVVLLEYSIGHFYLFTWLKKTFSAAAVTTLVLMTVLPIAHLFLDDYIRGRFFHDLQLAFLIIRPVA